MLQYLEKQGISSSQATAASGIRLTFPAGSEDRIPGSQVEKLWRFAHEATGDPMVALHMTEAYSPGALDILGYVILSSRTIGEAFDRAARYARLLNDGMRIEIVREETVAYCRCTFVDQVDNYLLRSPEDAIDTLWAGFARELKRLTAKPLTPTEVCFRHRLSPDASQEEYQRIIGAPVKFGARVDRFVVPISHLDENVLSANPALLHTFEQHADTILGRMEQVGSKSHQVAKVLAGKLKGTVPPLSEIAHALAMSDRNLQRALRKDGTSFQKLLDEVRRGLAISHLANPATSTGQIGFLLGFSEPSAFHRAFRRWTGKAPGAYRNHLDEVRSEGRSALRV